MSTLVERSKEVGEPLLKKQKAISCSDDEEYCDYDSEPEKKIKEQFCLYEKQIEETGGFGVTARPEVDFFGGFHLVDLKNHTTAVEEIKEYVCRAIDDHNTKYGTKLVFSEIKHAVFNHIWSTAYYVTFEAVDSSSPTQERKTYETKLQHKRYCNSGMDVLIFRLKKQDML